MKTTLNISDAAMKQLKRESARQKRTMSDLVESALRLQFRRRPVTAELPPLPLFDSGGALVDISNRDALNNVMDRD